MILLAIANPRLNAVQNFMAAAVFSLLLATQASAYLLYLHPGSELLWMVTIPLNRICSPFLYAFDAWSGLGAISSIAVLAAAAAVPIMAQLARNWLGTACAGHVAFAVCALLTVGAMGRAGTHQASADLSAVFNSTGFDTNSAILALITAAFAALCLVNHVAFFARPRSS
jgi:hypothetical protein